MLPRDVHVARRGKPRRPSSLPRARVRRSAPHRRENLAGHEVERANCNWGLELRTAEVLRPKYPAGRRKATALVAPISAFGAHEGLWRRGFTRMNADTAASPPSSSRERALSALIRVNRRRNTKR